MYSSLSIFLTGYSYYKVIVIRNNHFYPHMIFPNSIANSQILRPKTALLRPLSQQRCQSPHHFSPHPKILQKSPSYRDSVNFVPQSEYYVNANPNPNLKEKARQQIGSVKVLPSLTSLQSLQTIRNGLMMILERSIRKLSDEIAKQSQQIRTLQIKIHSQREQIQTKDCIIQQLMNKLQRRSGEDRGSHEFRRIEDLQRRVGVMIDQIEEEKTAVIQKMEKMACVFVRYFGTVFQQSKKTITSFLLNKTLLLETISKGLDIISDQTYGKVLQLQGELQGLQISLKSIEDQPPKETCSQISLSKQTASHNSSTSSSKPKCEDLFLSDYFFHPSQTDNPSFKIIQELARERERLHQLPIRVFTDSFGRLKYYESRTYLFDRKGNFCTPTRKEASLLQQKGWIKIVQQ